MKFYLKLVKQIVALVTILAFTTATFAEVANYIGNTTATVSVIQAPAKVQAITFSNAGAGASLVTMYDAPTNVLTFVTAAWTGVSQYTTNVVSSFTNITGTVQTSTNSTLYTAPTTVAAATNNYRTVISQVIPAGGTVTITPPTGLFLLNGLAAAATVTNVTATVTYLSTR